MELFCRYDFEPVLAISFYAKDAISETLERDLEWHNYPTSPSCRIVTICSATCSFLGFIPSVSYLDCADPGFALLLQKPSS